MSKSKIVSSNLYCLNLSDAVESKILSKALLPNLEEKSKEYNLNLRFIQNPEHLENEPGLNGILAFGKYDHDAAEMLKNIRLNFSEQPIPVFVLMPHKLITPDMQELADKNEIKIVSLPISIDQLCVEMSNACIEATTGNYKKQTNLRRYSRVNVSHQAFTIVEVELIDVSIGGICFKTNTFYEKGKTDRIQFNDSELIDTVDFKVTKIETLEGEEFKFSVSASFETLQENVLSNISDSVIESETFL